jgi:hypothetical protein
MDFQLALMGVVASQLVQQEKGLLINPKRFAPKFITND